jgi:hemin uptake protein HemP
MLSHEQQPSRGADAVVVLRSEELFCNNKTRTVFIEHAGQRYQLRLTRENKLILTK